MLMYLLLGVIDTLLNVPGVAVKNTPLVTSSIFYPLGSINVMLNVDVGSVVIGVLTMPIFT